MFVSLQGTVCDGLLTSEGFRGGEGITRLAARFGPSLLARHSFVSFYIL